MNAMEVQGQGVRNLLRMGTRRSRKLILLKLMAMLSILLPALALPTVRAAEVPNVIGLTQTAAEAAIVAAKLTVGTVSTATSATKPVGTVISQDPVAKSKLKRGRPVDLVVSLGTAVPNVVGLTQAAAQTALTNAGLTVGTVTTAPSETVPAGTVISQTPTAGVNVSPGSAVALVISSGPPVFLMGVQNDPATGPLVNSLYRIRTDGVVTKIGDLTHRTHGLAFVAPRCIPWKS